MLVERFLLESPIAIDRAAIGLIASVCNKLADGSSTVNELWPGEPRSLSTLLADQDLFDKSQREMWALRGASRALEKLQSSLIAKIHFMQRTTIPAALHQGIIGIPTEILERILLGVIHEVTAFGYPNRKEYRKIIHIFSLVNRQFRSVILRLPLMLIDLRGHEMSWKNVNITRRQVHAFIHTGATFNFRVKFIANNLVRLSFGPGGNWASQGMYPNVRLFPRLEELNLDSCGEFISTHQLPSLRRIKTSIDASNSSTLVKIMPQLTHLSITISITSPIASALASVATTLAAGEKLRDLELRFIVERLPDSQGFEVQRKQISHSRCLPKVEAIQYTLYEVGSIGESISDSERQILSFLQAIDLPSLASFGVTVPNYREQGYATQLIQHITSYLRQARHKDCLRYLNLCYQYECDLMTMNIQDLLAEIPNIQTLVLTRMRITMDDSSLSQLARLRDITMESCTFHGCTLKEFLARLLSAPYVGLKSLMLIDMGKVRTADLQVSINALQRVLDHDFYAEIAQEGFVVGSVEKARMGFNFNEFDNYGFREDHWGQWGDEFDHFDDSDDYFDDPFF